MNSQRKPREDGLETRQRIMDFLAEFIMENGFSPSIREIKSAAEIASTSGVAYHLNVLEIQGKISRQENQPRTIRLVGDSNGE